MKERNGVRLGQRVRNLDGKDLGKVTKLHEWGFETVKGLPVLIRDEHVFRYEDVHVREGETLLVARGEDDIFLLAEGKLPASWRVAGARAGFPTAASPSEGARLRLSGGSAPPAPPTLSPSKGRRGPTPAAEDPA